MTKSNERKLTIARAMAEATAQEMRIDPSVFVMGEDIGPLGGVYGNTRGLIEEFGAERIRDTPISETAFIGAAVGAAQDGMRPVVELMFVDFFGVCFDAIYNLMAKNIYFSGGNVKVPMVLMTSTGGGYSDGGQHSQCLYGTFAHLPGMKVVAPSNAYDAKGLMTAAMRDDSPVVYMYHKGLQGMGWLGTEAGATVHVPEETYTLEIGKAKVVREGKDVSIVSCGMGVHNALKAAKKLEEQGVSAEVVDLVSLVPLDRDTIRASVAKTGRLIVVDEDYMSYGLSGEIIASVTEHDISVLKAAPKRVAFPDVPIPFARVMEQFCLPNPDKIVAAWDEMQAA
ncbi:MULTISPECIES: alpha-ketoacid dehydrogenase subunit beta [Sulfitobacter]|uniref:Alpha-ketoacid dehydrogenase subunit beta n=3 Tax=Sulfitobacter TaxID=60136 RepID=A0AAU8C5T5_9RHOB|nr:MULTISPECIES: alpha-ketoacid dehydrogenase subunit beta [Sulfitobacter]MAX75545.1 alpha-ketoacid dehydrogenase subunit beta [Roseobacter sp.]PTA98236.1 alpha-ketoacid dehydrogenase subunit beta [Sulfitobacter sp. CB-A]ULO19641.1 alpha-ketoacid dehydrogenase subunit beta [Sulfitobacter sp. CB2047]HAR84052.1 alpha-ketoacid dehydrogenase subunit beta [Sulfitobacter pontiacus]HBR40920.1 alpha-ketoacid dehydrogenase subunit beta [Sulfitobacter pontiacus]|tara:strand:- start:132 stop:1151 length:1020 start_codon:yes stop_codon:yes gene_type:complete